MERENQTQSQKISLSLKVERSVDNPQRPEDQQNSVEGAPGTSGNSFLHVQEQVNIGSAGGAENQLTEDGEKKEDTHLQMVPYDPSVNCDGETGNVPDPGASQTPSSSRRRVFPNQMPRISPFIGAFTVQCANCFKWRLVPTEEKYEEIRENIIEHPFICETGREWRPNISCEDPPDITQDGSRLWAIDKPSIARTPPGWQRLLKIRGEGGTRFADVYYVSPMGKRLRSLVEVERYLHENPQYTAAGIELAKFSFQIPRPLQENYVRKRPPQPPTTNEPGSHGIPGSNDTPAEAVVPISWAAPERDEQTFEPGSSTEHLGSTSLMPKTQSSKKQRT